MLLWMLVRRFWGGWFLWQTMVHFFQTSSQQTEQNGRNYVFYFSFDACVTQDCLDKKPWVCLTDDIS